MSRGLHLHRYSYLQAVAMKCGTISISIDQDLRVNICQIDPQPIEADLRKETNLH